MTHGFVSESSPEKAPQYELPDDNQAWDNFDYRQLHEILHGSSRQVGYYERTRRLNLRVLGIDISASQATLIEPRQVVSDFQQARLDYYADQSCLLYDQEKGAYASLPLLCRGMNAYQARVGDKFDDVVSFVESGNKPVILLSLSARWSPEESPLDHLIKYSELVNRFISWLTPHLPEHSSSFNPRLKTRRPYYVWTIEPHKRGTVHIHLAFIGNDYLIPQVMIDRWWQQQGLGTSQGVDIRKVRDVRDLKNYLVGYILKKQGCKGSFEWHGLLSLTSRRSFGISNGLSCAIRKWKARYSPESSEPVSACLGTNNSKKSFRYRHMGCHPKAVIEPLVAADEAGRIPPPDEVLESLREIRAFSRAWHNGDYLPRSARPVGGAWRQHVESTYLSPSTYEQAQQDRLQVLLDEGSSFIQVLISFPDLGPIIAHLHPELCHELVRALLDAGISRSRIIHYYPDFRSYLGGGIDEAS